MYVVNHARQAIGFLVNGQLPVGPGTLFKYGVDIVD